MSQTQSQPKHIIIIGAGPAGLTTAYELLKNTTGRNISVTILEEASQVGGISKTIQFGDYLVDTGIHRFFSKSDQINQLWNELLPLQSQPAYDDVLLGRDHDYPTTGSNPEKEDRSMLIKNRITRIYYKGKFFDYPVSLSWQTISNLGFAKILKVGWTYLLSLLHKRPEINLENFYINSFGQELYETFFKHYTTKVWGLSPDQLSAEWGAQRVKGISIFEILKDIGRRLIKVKTNDNTQTSLVDHFVYPKLGAGQIWEVMAQEIEKMGGHIILNSQVTSLKTGNKHITQVQYKTGAKLKSINCDVVVSSMPIKDLFEAMGNEDIDPEIYKAATKLPYRDFIDVYLVTNKLKLKNETNVKTVANIIPDDWIYLQDESLIAGRMQVFNNWSPYLFKDKRNVEKKFLISLEYFASMGDDLWTRSDDEMCALAIAEAVKIGLIDKVEDAVTWKSHKIVKAYPAYFGTYEKMDEIRKYLDSISNLYCVGRNGQHRYNNMDHSMLTGIECAHLIMSDSNDKSTLWNINTEKEYHEERK